MILSENRSPSFGMVRDEGIGRGGLKFSRSLRAVESNKKTRDDAVTTVRKPAYLPPLTA
jgi:hypothetical protein